MVIIRGYFYPLQSRLIFGNNVELNIVLLEYIVLFIINNKRKTYSTCIKAY